MPHVPAGHGGPQHPHRNAAGRPPASASGGNDRLIGLTAADNLDGGAGNDTRLGGRDNDRLTGGLGNDSLDGGLGRDVYVAGTGNDIVRSRDGLREVVSCGLGRDIVIADRLDVVLACERILRP